MPAIFRHANHRQRHISRFASLSLVGAAALAGLLALSLYGCKAGEGAAPNAEQTTPSESVKEPSVTEEPQHEADEPQSQPESTDPDAARVEALMDGLTLEQKVAQLFFVRPESITGVGTTTQAGDATREAIAHYPVGGIVYFGQNLLDPDQTKSLLANTQRYSVETAGVPAFLGVDEEGGTVSRVGGNPGFPIENVGNMADIDSADDAYAVATEIGAYLSDLGFNTNFAPDADIANNPESDTMALRAFGTTADEAAPLVAAQVEGFTDQKILCSAKHFPGIGGVLDDSHDASIYSSKTFEEMAEEELIPFEAAIKADVPFVMVGHLSTPEATGNNLPASVSPDVVTGLLRETLSYEGVVITDSLEMGAVCDLYSPADIGVAVLEAGADMILMPADFATAYQGVLDAVESGALTEERIDQSVERILRAKLPLMD